MKIHAIATAIVGQDDWDITPVNGYDHKPQIEVYIKKPGTGDTTFAKEISAGIGPTTFVKEKSGHTKPIGNYNLFEEQKVTGSCYQTIVYSK